MYGCNQLQCPCAFILIGFWVSEHRSTLLLRFSYWVFFYSVCGVRFAVVWCQDFIGCCCCYCIFEARNSMPHVRNGTKPRTRHWPLAKGIEKWFRMANWKVHVAISIFTLHELIKTFDQPGTACIFKTNPTKQLNRTPKKILCGLLFMIHEYTM